MSVCGSSREREERVLVEWESGCKCVTRCSTRGFKRGTGALDTVREGEGNPRTHSTHLCRHLVFFLSDDCDNFTLQDDCKILHCAVLRISNFDSHPCPSLTFWGFWGVMADDFGFSVGPSRAPDRSAALRNVDHAYAIA
jgi:hypothetical protein